jgi:hypothetical protein
MDCAIKFMDTRISITKNQADALRADITEINQMVQLVQMKNASNRRVVEMIVRDADQDPALFAKYTVEEKNGKFELISVPEQQGGFVNGAPPPQQTQVTQ